MATKQQVEAFINLIAPSVIANCKNHGWGVPSAIIAQAGLESAWGTSKLWIDCFNGWGMKFKDGCGTDYKAYTTREQRKDGTYYSVVAKFRKWTSVSAGINGYFQFIESYSRYKPVKQARNYADYAIQLKACGWATSIKYANNIIDTVKAHNLTQYDNGYISEYQIGKIYITNNDLYVRDAAAGKKMLRTALTANGQKYSFEDNEGFAILQKGTSVTCKGITVKGGNTWMKIPSGWICAKQGAKKYIG